MPVTHEWYSEDKRILIMKFTDPWAWDEMFAAREAALQDYDGQHRVDIIVDFSRTDQIPPNAIVHGRNALKKVHPQQGVQVYIDAPPTLKTMLDVAGKMFPQLIAEANFSYAESFEGALERIHTLR